MPVAYLVERREFYSLPFRVTSDVLIPRPETELLVVRLADLPGCVRQADCPTRRMRVADVGTRGSIIAICAAKRFPTCHVTAIDKSAGRVASRPSQCRTAWRFERIEFVEGDLLSRSAALSKRSISLLAIPPTSANPNSHS